METALDTEFATGKKQGLDVNRIRADFPMLNHEMNGKRLIYFDSAATNHKPQVVIDRLVELYTSQYAKPQEAHPLSEYMTFEMENTRAKIADFIKASDTKEIVFTKNSTEGINIVANGFARSILSEGDEIIITALEHQANIVPWQMACDLSGAKIVVVPLNEKGEVTIEAVQHCISHNTKIISISHSSNVLGSITPIKEIAQLAHSTGIPVLLDAAQTAPHMPIDVKELDIDYMVFSIHKMGGPAGIGILYGKKDWLEKIPPHNGGSENAKDGTYQGTIYKSLPKKFESGTPPFEQIAAVSVLIDYVTKLDMQKTSKYEEELLDYATDKLSQIDKIKIYGTSSEKEPVLSFLLEGKDVKDMESYLVQEHNIYVRAGKLSSQPLMKYLGVDGLLRASFCYYNTREEIDSFVKAVREYAEK